MSTDPTLSFPTHAFQQATLVNANMFEWLDTQPDNTFHAVLTDPPYGVVEYESEQQEKLRAGSGGVWRQPPTLGGVKRSPLPRFTTLTPRDIERLEAFFATLAEKLLRVVVPGAHVALATNPLVSHYVSYQFSKAGWERRGEVVRLVQTMRGGDRPKGAETTYPDVSVMPRSQWEPWLLFRKELDGTVAHNLARWGTGALRRISDEQPFGDVIKSHPTHATEKRLANHPSLKPQDFLRPLTRALLPLGTGILLDPFAGSASTLAAANHLGYDSVGVERDKRYFLLGQEALPRLTAHTPKTK